MKVRFGGLFGPSSLETTPPPGWHMSPPLLRELRAERDEARAAIDAVHERMEAAEAERDRYEAALKEIATQGIGRFDHERRCLIDANGLLWVHWAERAQRALNQKEVGDG